MIGAATRIRLLAEREFTAYVASITFWVALALGPVSMAAMLALAQLSPGPAGPPVSVVAIDAPDATVRATAVDAISALEALAGTPITISPERAPTRIIVQRRQGQLTLEITGRQSLPPLARAFLLDRIALRERDEKSRPGNAPPAPLDLTQAPAPGANPSPAPGVVKRVGAFALATILWMTLTGSMGMLLQAVVRERANRGLETLLALARPLEIIIGKLAGVGAVSALVVGAWLGAGAALAILVPHSNGLAGALMSGMTDPAALARSAGAYLMAYLLYGLATVAIGSTAGDTAAAQNLSRPLFAVLVIVFFVISTTMTGASAMVRWLVFVPPFTPFLLILESYNWVEQSLAICLLVLAILAAATVAQKTARLKN